jgi:hypothetical protein
MAVDAEMMRKADEALAASLQRYESWLYDIMKDYVAADPEAKSGYPPYTPEVRFQRTLCRFLERFLLEMTFGMNTKRDCIEGELHAFRLERSAGGRIKRALLARKLEEEDNDR